MADVRGIQLKGMGILENDDDMITGLLEFNEMLSVMVLSIGLCSLQLLNKGHL